MSFHWNLSSDEEDHDYWTTSLEKPPFDDTKVPPRKVTPNMDANLTNLARRRMDEETDLFVSEDEDEEVDWQDADNVEENVDLDMKPDAAKASLSLQPVTIDLNGPLATKVDTEKRSRVARRVYRFHSLPWDLQALLLDIQQSHLVSLTSRAVQISQCCSDWELLHLAYSLVPLNESGTMPFEASVKEFASWYFNLVNGVVERRRQTHAANAAAGAPVGRNRQRQKKAKVDLSSCLATTDPGRLYQVSSYLSSANDENPHLCESLHLSPHDKTQLLISMARSIGWRARYVTVLDPVGCDLNVDHPLVMGSIGDMFRVLSSKKRDAIESKKPAAKPRAMDENVVDNRVNKVGWVEILCQQETKSKRQTYRWIHVDPENRFVDQPSKVEAWLEVMHRTEGDSRKRKRHVAFVLAVEHISLDSHNAESESVARDTDDTNLVRLTDVTARYANSWSQSLLLRSPKRRRSDGASDSTWWRETLKTINSFHAGKVDRKSNAKGSNRSEAIEIMDSSEGDTDDKKSALHPNDHESIDRDEKAELLGSADGEAIPTSKEAFKNHPVYVISSVLKSNEVLAPDAKNRICGIFKGEPVYRRNDAHTALVAKRWLYEGRRVRKEEMAKPIKMGKARKKPTPKGFQPLQSYGVGNGNDGSEMARQKDIAKGSVADEEDDGMNKLYAFWQTEPWSPSPVGPNDPIPVNEYNNVELELLNAGLEHLVEPRMSKVAKQLGIPYAPCLVGFEGHGGNRTPSIRGIVVHEHNAALLREAHSEFMSSSLEQEYENRKLRIHKRWKKLMVGLLTKERLEREYG